MDNTTEELSIQETLPVITREHGDVFHLECEARGTSYRLVFSKLSPPAAIRETAPWLVSLLSPVRGAYAFQDKIYGFLHWSYVHEKFPGLTMVDAKIVARLIGDFLGRPSA